ncbi:MAG: RluA family pseudouridine synthase [Candidatus Omnitrophica bacterium]|nr:RluA family pseudouridine synthase [Candidatus Omnitrophota bacterium]
MQQYQLQVLPEESGSRIDLVLFSFFKKQNAGFSRMFVQQLIRIGNVSCGQQIIVRPHYKVKALDAIRVLVEEKTCDEIRGEDIPLDIVYDDAFLAVLNKPPGLVVHPAPGNATGTLVNALIHRFKKLSTVNPHRPGIVHRLDKETSGLLVIAKDNATHLNLTAQFSAHSITRVYVALVKGKMEFDEQVIEVPIGRHPFRRKNMAVGFGEHTKFAKTLYRTLTRFNDLSLVELRPYTGRTHQLRVHLAHIGHPILGDEKYSQNNDFGRLYLHARLLGFVHPGTDKYLEFSSKVPEEFLRVCNSQGIKNT